MALTTTQLWLVVVALVVGFAALGYAANKWLLKGKFDQKLAIGAGLAVGVVLAAIVWWTKGKKMTAVRAAKIEVNREGEVVAEVTPETYIEAVATQ